MRLVQPVYAREILIKPFQPPRRYCEVPGKIEKALFTTVVFEAGTSLFMCGKVLITPFYPPRRFSEARADLFK